MVALVVEGIERPAATSDLSAAPLHCPDAPVQVGVRADAEVPITAWYPVQVVNSPEMARKAVDEALNEGHVASRARPTTRFDSIRWTLLRPTEGDPLSAGQAFRNATRRAVAAPTRQHEQYALVTDELTDDDLDEIEGRAEASLAGPWEAFVEGRDHSSGDDFIRTGGLDDVAPDMYVSLSYWNSDPPKPAGAAVLDFIAAARQDVPRLVTEIRRLRRTRHSGARADLPT